MEMRTAKKSPAVKITISRDSWSPGSSLLLLLSNDELVLCAVLSPKSLSMLG